MNFTCIGDNFGRVGELAVTHASLALPAILASVVVALPIGWVAHRWPRGRDVLVSAAGILYAIPSLALFIVMPLVLGTSIVSPLNVVVALTLYGIALQVRTTADAFDSVPAVQRQTAVALGYGPLRRVLQVELPLAGPIILGGARVVSASTISLISVGALIGVSSLGSLFTEGFQRSFPTEIFVGIVATVVLALLFDAVLVLIGRLSMPWRRAA